MRSKADNIPDSVHYVANTNANINTMWGVSTTGVQIYNAISADGVDPFYPAKYGHVIFPEDYLEKVD